MILCKNQSDCNYKNLPLSKHFSIFTYYKIKTNLKIDILIIGSGPAGSSVAHRCVEAGKSVLIVDKLFGGTCALRGCTPKKAMEAVTSTFWQAKKMEKAGFPTTKQFVDWHQLVANKSHYTALVPTKTKSNFENANIKTLTGTAKFVDQHTIKVGNKTITAKQIVIATGAKPRPLNIEGEQHLVTNDEFFNLNELPPTIVIVGGGYIAFELSHIIAACGSNVTIIGDEEMPLTAFDADLVQDLVHATLQKGIDIKLGYSVNKVEKINKGFEVTCKRNDDMAFTYSADLIIHAAGRIPNVENLAVEQIGLKLNEQHGIEVNKFMQTKKYDHIYAIGDVTGQLPFTETASYEAKIAAHNIINKKRKSVDYKGVPFGVFTYPKLTKVGKSEEELNVQGIKFDVKKENHKGSFIERVNMNNFARYKTLVDKKTGKILGASILASHADDMINLFSLAIQQGMTVQQFKDLLLLYPTAAHDIKYMV